LDNKRAGFMATNALVEQGHKNIAIFTFPIGDKITTRVERIQGYTKALHDKNIILRRENIINCQLEDVKANLDKLMAQEDHPTGIVATNDMLLEEILIWVKERKIEIPKTFSLVGIDNVSFAELFTPEITTLSQPISDIGVKASELLLRLIKNNDEIGSAARVYRYEPTINKRKSINKI